MCGKVGLFPMHSTMDSSSVLPTLAIITVSNALTAAIMSFSSPRRELADIGSSINSPNLLINDTSKQRSPNYSWTNPFGKSISSPPKRVSASPTFGLAQDAVSTQHSPHAGDLSPRRIRLDPRISKESRIDCKPVCHSSYTEDPKGILHPRGYRHVAVGSSSSNESNSYTMTPTVMFSEEVDHQQIEICSKRQDQQFHHSPHWTGKVRINPFSPVPPKYLEPPSSKPFPQLSDYVEFPVLSGKSLKPLQPSHHGARRSRRLKPKMSETFPPIILENNVSPTDVFEDTFNGKSPRKRKSGISLGLPQSVSEDQEPPMKQMKLTHSRYLHDFEQVRHLGSGSFGSVNACLSRLDGCMYAIKSLSPHGIQRSKNAYGSAKIDTLYGGRKTTLGLPQIPPTPRRDATLTPKKKKWQNTNTSGEQKQDLVDEGSEHWTEFALKRMLREVSFDTKFCFILLPLTRTR